jgi:YGGT family
MSEQTPPVQPAPVDRVAVVTEESRYNFRAAAIVGFVAGVVNVLIAMRFLLRLLGASAQSAFVNAVYAVSGPLVAPFHGIFGDSASNGSYFETAALVAIIVYALIGWGLIVLVRILTAPHGTKPSVS